MTPEDKAAVTELLGRAPRGECEVVVRRVDGSPVVIRNAPNLADGTPMPTLYWLIGPDEAEAVSRFEAIGGVKMAERAVDPVEVAAAHDRYAAEREAYEPAVGAAATPAPAPIHRPTGGVGGTRVGVKCLHAHIAWWLAGGDDPVGRWTAKQISLDPSGYQRADAGR